MTLPDPRILPTLLLLLLSWGGYASAQTILFEESFETDGNGTRYTTSVPEFSDGSNDFFTRTDGGNVSSGYVVSGADGSFFFAAQDIDGESPSSTQTLTLTGIDIAGASNLSFTGLFAEDDDGSNQDWDASDVVFVEVSLDGAPFTKIIQFANDGSAFNSPAFLDTDFDGIGDGTELTDAFQSFSADIAGTGSTLDVRITCTLSAGDEDIAFDALTISGDAGGSGGGRLATLLQESFETDGEGTRYDASEVCTDGSGDFFIRTDGSNIGGSYNVSGQDGDFFWAGMDLDGAPCDGGDTESLTFAPVDITGFSNLAFSGLFAEDDDGSNQDWDGSSRVSIEYQIDGGTWVEILRFAAAGGTNSEPRQDTDFDGIGDGTALTDALTEFTAPIPATSGLLTLRITAQDLNAGDEDIAFDLIEITGEAPAGCEDASAPTPVCVGSLDLYLDETGAATLNPADLDEGSTDDCSLPEQLTFTASQTSFTCGDLGSQTVALTITDASGQASTCDVSVNVIDSVSPEIFTTEATVRLDASGQGTLSAADLDGAGSDNCGAPSITLSQETFDCDDVSEMAVPTATDLFFSEYVEGSGNNKYLEIFNGTGAMVDLSAYEVRVYNNGNAAPNSTYDLSGMLADGEVVVLANNQATIYGGAAVTASAATSFNGDDAIALAKKNSGTLVDVLGRIGEDPGSQWKGGGVETKDQTLRRKTTVSAGLVPGVGFPELADQWEEASQNDVSGLGSHSLSAVVSTIPVMVTATDGSGNETMGTVEVRVTDPLGACDILPAPEVTIDPDTAFFPYLSWNKVDDATGYEVYRDLNSSGTFSLLYTLGMNDTAVYDVVNDPTVDYYVVALNATEQSAPSNTVSYSFTYSDRLGLSYACYDPATDSLTWEVSSTNDQWVPFIYAQWWSGQRDTLYAAPNSTVSFRTQNHPQDPNTFGDDNITGIWYWAPDFQGWQEVVTTGIDLGTTCGGLRRSFTQGAPQAHRVPMDLPIDRQANRDAFLASQLTIGPNPFRHSLEVRSTGIEAAATFRVMSATGQLVVQKRGSLAEPTKLDLRHLSQGVYFLQVQVAGASVMRQVVKE